MAETLFLECFSKPNKEISSKVKLKTENFGNKEELHPLLKKAIFRKLADNWTHKKHKMITEQKKQIAWNHYKYRPKINGPVSAP